jgi:hypothetical protein
MAKMFYTIDEVAAKLKKTPDEVKAMAKSGQIQEFRDRDKLMFKVDQIDLLAGSDEESGEVHLDLEDANQGSSVIGLTGSGIDLKEESSIGLADSREGTGISVFDTDHGSDASHASGTGTGTGMGSRHGSGSGAAINVAGETQVGEAVDDELSLESVGSGSGLLDLTRESDDTSLGAELLEEVYSGDENIEIPANASGLFEAAAPEPAAEAVRGGIAMPVMIEVYDGTGSGLGAGLMIGALVAIVCAAIVAVVGLTGSTPKLATMFASSSNSIYMWSGGLLAITIIFGLIGMFLGKASE